MPAGRGFQAEVPGGKPDALHALGFCYRQGFFEQRHVGNDALALDATTGAHDQFRFRVRDARGQFPRGETAEYDRVDRADPGAAEHRDHRFRNHRHIDDHAVAFCYAARLEGARKPRRLVAQFSVTVLPDLAGDRAVVDQGGLPASAGSTMTVQRIVAGIDLGATEPFVIRRDRAVQHLVPGLVPFESRGRFGPERFRVFDRVPVYGFV